MLVFFKFSKKILLAAIILLVLNVKEVYLSCDKGCLKCDVENNSCLICDITEQFNLNAETKCEKKEIENCEILNFKQGVDECLKCSDGLVFDFNSEKCEAVPSSKFVANCKSYNISADCTECKQNFYMKNGECHEIFIEVEHCLEFSDRNFCSICEGARIYNEDSGTCEDFEPSPNCLSHSFVKCDSCSGNQIINRNLTRSNASINLDSPIDIPTIIYFNKDKSFNGMFRKISFDQCETPKFDFCEKYEFTNGQVSGCVTCAVNYLLDENKECKPYPFPIISNCFKYLNGENCFECNPNFYLDSNECKEVQIDPNCSAYSKNADSCETCVDSHFLNANSCELRENTPISNCESLDNTKDQCMKCLEGNKLTDDNLLCLPIINNCDLYKSNSKNSTNLECQSCLEKYYSSENDTVCVEQNVQFCKKYELNLNSCNECNDNYYVTGTSPNKTCALKNLQNCRKYTSDQENHCQECENLYSLELSNKTCVALADTNCSRNTLNQTECLACKVGYFLNNSSSMCEETTLLFDERCLETGSEEGICTKCINEYVPFQLSFHVINLPPNCFKADSSTDACLQCADDSDGDDTSGTAICSNALNKIGICKRLKEGIFEALDQNDSKCDLCRDYSTHYLEGNTCKERTESKSINCSQLNPNSDECQVCDNNFAGFIFSSDNKYLCQNSGNGFVSIPDCEVYDYTDSTQCLECSPGKINNSTSCDDPVSPLDIYSFSYYSSDENKWKTGKMGTPNGDPNCAKTLPSSSDSESQVCIECADNYIMKTISPSKNNIYSGKIIFDENEYISGGECKPMSDVFWISPDTNSGKVDNCGIYSGSDIDKEHFCYFCKSGFVPKFKKMNFKHDFTAISISKDSISECVSASDIGLSQTNKYYSHNENPKTGFRFKEFYDTCSDETMNPVYFIFQDASGMIYGKRGSTGAESTSVICHEVDSKISNCLAYSSDSGDSPADANIVITECVICAPGYALNNGKTNCLPISNCDISDSSQNTWNNACQTCKENYNWPLSLNGKFVDLSKCELNSSPVANCVYYTLSECSLCKKGFYLSEDNSECIQYEESCADLPLPRINIDITTWTSLDPDLRKFLSSLFSSFFFDQLPNGIHSCNGCTDPKKYFSVSNPSSFTDILCIDKENISQIEGCSSYAAKSNPECLECEEGYLFNMNQKNCVKITENEHYYKCSKLMNHSTNECAVCKNRYLPDSTNICRDEHNCLDSSEEYADECKVCEEGFKPSADSNNPQNCIPIIDDKVCGQYGKNNVCLKCKDCNATPLFNKSNAENTICVLHDKVYDDVFKYNILYFTNSSNLNEAGKSLDSNPIPTNKYISNNFTHNQTSVPKTVCVRRNYDLNCKVRREANSFFCDECKEGFYFDSEEMICKKFDSKCKEANSSDPSLCESCHNTPLEINNNMTFYKNSLNSCSVHSAKNCKSFSAIDDECEDCKNLFYQKTISGSTICTQITKSNCLQNVLNQNICSKCISGYYLEGGSNTCMKNTAQNCETFSENSNTCGECADNFYKNGDLCLENTADNCQSKSKTSNTCESCIESENAVVMVNKDSVGCVEQTQIENCKIMSSFLQSCGECNDGFYLRSANQICESNPTGVKNCSQYSNFDTCTLCKSGYYLESNVCVLVENPIDGCVDYLNASECNNCQKMKLTNETKTECVDVNEISCSEWTDIDNCSKCSGNNILKTTEEEKVICVSSGLNSCLEAQFDSNPAVCNFCRQNFILREGKCFSPKTLIDNCEVYNTDTELCDQCFDGLVLSANKNSCLDRMIEAGSNCAKAHIPTSNQLVCNLCDKGYFFNSDGDCEKCGGNGCHICDLNDTSKCLLCQNNYYMSTSSLCAPNEPVIEGSVKITEIMISMFAFVLFMFFN